MICDMNITYVVGNTYRYFGLFSILCKNHYDALGLTPKATQGEIKAAYYKLSMIYHPDKNKGSDSASEKFKAITSAYEVLGNLKLRRLYDRGLSSDDAHLSDWVSQEPTKYSAKSSRIPTTKATSTGRTPIYDFDAWSRVHYGKILERRAQAKAKYEDKFGYSVKKRQHQTENSVYSLMIFVSFIFLFSYAYKSNAFDISADKSKKSK